MIEQRGVVRFLWAKNMDAAEDIHKEMLPNRLHDCSVSHVIVEQYSSTIFVSWCSHFCNK
jgi:hypothetical protein